MPAGDSNKQGSEAAAVLPEPGRWGIPAGELELLRRLAIVTVLGFLFVAAFVRLQSTYGHKFFDVTGRAYWIWPRMDISRGNPVAFFATRDFDLPSNRYYTKIKILGDPEYRLYFNGQEIGGRRAGRADTLDVYDVSRLSKDGRNRIVVAVRATQGVGGLLVSVDLGPDFENFVVTDSSWRMTTTWSPQLLVRDTPAVRSPMILGAPPFGRWNYLHPRTAAASVTPAGVRKPVATFGYAASLPVVRVVSGTAIVAREQLRATAFDFGEIDGVLRLTRSGDLTRPALVKVRLANVRSELPPVEGEVRSYAFAAGESAVVDTEMRHFRYVGVYRDAAVADALVNK